MKTITFLFLLMFMMTQIISGQAPPIEAGVSQSLAKWRAANYRDVRYKLNITLEKGAPLMKGNIEITVNLTETGAKNDLILDWRNTQFANDKDKPFADVVAVNEMTGAQAARLHRRESGETAFIVKSSLLQSEAFSRSALIASEPLAFQSNEHLIIPSKFLKTGENVIKINFASPIKTSGAAVTRYVDKEDNAEYVYSLFVPSDASTAFPVFDQPDLKARFQLNVTAPNKWRVITNTYNSYYKRENKGFVIDSQESSSVNEWSLFTKSFEETKPISTYVFAFAAGDFAEVSEPSAVADGLTRASNNSNKGDSKNSNASNDKLKPPATADGSDLSSKIYVRKSQAEKFKQHAAEVFRLNREGVKFLEDWFDYKFPFPKYDLVLIPEFPFGGMEHAGATFLREDRVIFPTEPTKNDYITRANVIFHEAAHQWFGDTVTMKWFDDLWLKEGFAEFMAYKTLAKVMPEYNAWKIFYERNKQAAYLTDVTRGTTPIYQEIPNLSSAKSAYGNIVYRKAPSFLRQAEFYLGEKEFQTAVRQFLKKHEFANAEWTDLVKEFELASKQDLKDWANVWVKQRGVPKFRIIWSEDMGARYAYQIEQTNFPDGLYWKQKLNVLVKKGAIYYTLDATVDKSSLAGVFNGINGYVAISKLYSLNSPESQETSKRVEIFETSPYPKFIFPNYQDYGYGIFLLDEKSRAFVLANIQTEKDDFLRSMMWGSLWDSVRFYELAPEEYVKLVIKNLGGETDESTIATLLGRVSTAMNYYLPEEKAKKLGLELEQDLYVKMSDAPTVGQRITFYRAFLNVASIESAPALKYIYYQYNKKEPSEKASKLLPLKTKDRFDIVTKLITLGDADGLKLLAELEKISTDDAAKRYAYAARAGIPTAENKLKYWKDFISNKEISESWIESAFNVWNTPKHAELTLPYLEKSLAELPNLKKNRKIFFVGGWLSAFIGGQKSAEALKIVNDFLEKNPNLDRDLRLKILENVDNLERAVKIRSKYVGKN